MQTSIEIFDLVGNKISTLVDRKMPAGQHTFSFDGSQLASGVYYYTLTTDNFKQTKKMLLLK